MDGLISQYVASLRRDLAFDPALADRMAREVEDHLRDAAETNPAWPAPEAEARAIERFGLAREIAAQFAADAAERQTRLAWLTSLAAIVVTLTAMRLRVIWLDDGAPFSIAPLVDRYAFWAAVAAAAIGWCAFRHALAPLALCLAGLAASVAAGFIRADMLMNAPLHVTLASAVEVLVLSLLSLHLVRLGLHLKYTAPLRRLKP
jgi:hypothetical protein